MSTDDESTTTGTAASVVVVTYNSASSIVGLLESLDAGLTAVDRHEVVVVDNDSSDATVDLVRRLRPSARVLPMGWNAGYAAAINAGIAVTTLGGAVLVLNPDVRLHPGCVSALLGALRIPGVGIAVPQLVNPDGQVSPSLRRDPSVVTAWSEAVLGGGRAGRLGLGEVVSDLSVYGTSHDGQWATGAVLAISAACRTAVGPWDDSFFLYSEEVDYCQRARALGFRVRYEPGAVATHVGGRYRGDPPLWARLIRSKVLHYSRHHGRLATAAFVAGIAGGELLRAPTSASARAGLVAALRPGTPPQPFSGPPLTERNGARGDGAGRDAARPPGFVWFAAQDWWYHNRAHSDFQLMREVARERPVLLVNSLGLRVPRKGVSTRPWRRIGRKLRSMTKLVRRPDPELPNFHVMTPLFLPLYGDTVGARLNAWLVRLQVTAVARWIGVGGRPYLATTLPTAWPVVRGMRRTALLYNHSDLHSAFPEADGRRIAALEHELLAHADRVLYVSRELMVTEQAVVGERAVFLDHGVDLDHFSADDAAPEPAEMTGIPRPRVGFFGGIDDYVLDMELLVETARAVPEAQLVLIGDATCSMDELTSLPNVHWLGHQPYERIPDLGRCFDVAVMPWLDNEWIRFANPIKLKEYLALGLPVVTTEYPEVDDYRDRVSVARDRADFVDLIRRGLADPGDPVARRASVLDSSWKARARFLVDVAADAGGR